MRVVAFMMGNSETETGDLPDPEGFAEMGRFNDGLTRDGVLLAAEGLKPTSQAAKLRWSGSGPTVIDGPFTETKEIVAGFWIVEVGSLAEAKERFKSCPCGDGAEIQLRPIWEADDLGDLITDKN